MRDKLLRFAILLSEIMGLISLIMKALVRRLSGVIIGDLCETPSHYQSIEKFSEKLSRVGVSGIAGVDTRHLLKRFAAVVR